jgi:heme A synthase
MPIDGGVFFRFLIAALATWRLAFLLARESGPWDAASKFRRVVGGGLVGEMLRCVKCLGLWVAAPFAFFVRGDWPELVVIWLALGGVTALIDEWTRPPFEWQETREEGLMGQEANRGVHQVVTARDRRETQ